VIDEENNLIIEWMRGSQAPEAVLQLFSCKCVRACKLPDCEQAVMHMCKLQTYTNQREEDGNDEAYEEAAPDDSDTDELLC
jgi:hypothetical protein